MRRRNFISTLFGIGAAFGFLKKFKPFPKGWFMSEFKYYYNPSSFGARDMIFHQRDFYGDWKFVSDLHAEDRNLIDKI